VIPIYAYGGVVDDLTDGSGVYVPPVRRRAVGFADITDVFQQGDIAGAEALLEQAAQARPDDAQVLYVLAYVLVLEDKYEAAASAMRQAVATDEPMAHKGSAVLAGFYDPDQADKAVRRLNEFVKGRPDDTSALLLRVYIHLLTSQP
jgi:thioredoxin-like negative regulator of GroEL